MPFYTKNEIDKPQAKGDASASAPNSQFLSTLE